MSDKNLILEMSDEFVMSGKSPLQFAAIRGRHYYWSIECDRGLVNIRGRLIHCLDQLFNKPIDNSVVLIVTFTLVKCVIKEDVY